MSVPHEGGFMMVRLLISMRQVLFLMFIFLISGVMKDKTQVIKRRNLLTH